MRGLGVEALALEPEDQRGRVWFSVPQSDMRELTDESCPLSSILGL